jgi:hypothetical protein
LKKITTQTGIKAKPERIWDILTDFSSYELWNPFMTKIIGEPNLGNKIEVHIRTIRGKNRVYHPVITKLDENKELKWQGRSILPGIFDGERIFQIESTSPEEVTFTHMEIFSGLGAKFLGRGLDHDLQQGFQEMNNALKARAESSV